MAICVPPGGALRLDRPGDGAGSSRFAGFEGLPGSLHPEPSSLTYPFMRYPVE